MTQSIRERILQAIVRVLTPLAPDQAATVWRTPSAAIPREQCPALVVLAESESLAERANDRVTRELTVRVTALVRVVPPLVAETQADALLCAAHAALMTDTNLGGLALGIREVESEWEVDDADGVAASVSARYQITYRTLVANIAIQG
ncbi:MAG: hypothetical protein KBF66_03025 [Rhodoferax sp.]|uniref:hypothetical protein n=1 Tax=Rhodoferax sp. TaxID=50421 RepID=UPI001B5FE4E2|nr:hypothetical protein [Rhodoferax sp.]MBP9904504.1 hypothetical protein [Rhodoferax sp.]